MSTSGSGIYGVSLYGGDPPNPGTLTLVVQDVYPDRVVCLVQGLTIGDTITLERRVAGEDERTTIRSADNVTATGTTLMRVDAEQPFGVNLTYYLIQNGIQVDEETVVVGLEGQKVALTDAIAGNAAEAVVLAWPSRKRSRASSVFAVGGRNIVVTGDRGGFSGNLDLFTETDAAKDNLFNLLTNATSGIIQVRQSGGYSGVDCYISVLADDEVRWSQDGSDERRVISLDVVETDGWATDMTASTSTLQDIADTYIGGGTLTSLNIDFPSPPDTLLSIALAVFE